RLVFLNACETAGISNQEGIDPFAGVATALVMAGIPSAIAMQLPISDPAAIAFSHAVHLRLAAGDPVDVAVADGRQAVFAAGRSTMEWAIPILFSRVADGRIFDRGEPSEHREDSPPSLPEPRKARPLPALAWSALALATILILTVIYFQRSGGSLRAFLGIVERPVLDTVQVGALRVARHEVTQNEFLQFVLANPQWRRDRIDSRLHDGDYLKPWISWRQYPPELDHHPVTRVSWFSAQAFCEWMGGRLPTRQEWQEVAHAESHFPWGQKAPSGSLLNFCDRECLGSDRNLLWSDGFVETAPVGSFPGGATKEGILDLSGNVWEWTMDATETEKPAMGGSYLSLFDECSTDKPAWEKPTLCAADGGFRCVWD
ncbi:MAG TPA: SUMF1/EgtB/PvdO family nonheme iron enzyme, partial [Gemmatimonadales bacterium]|nr:SUMF1/EgtB/PvdO family nonheme iron enzyme [Gemmatimonadales bacterium]